MSLYEKFFKKKTKKERKKLQKQIFLKAQSYLIQSQKLDKNI